MLVNGVHSEQQKVSFKNIQKIKDNHGYEAHELSVPCDTQRYTPSVEIVRVVKDKKGDWYPDKNFEPKVIPMKVQEGATLATHSFDPADMFLPDQSFAYRFRFDDKDGKKTPVYHADNGIKIGKEDSDNVPYIIIHRNSPQGNIGGVMTHIVVDKFNPGVREKDGKFVSDPKERMALIHAKSNHYESAGGDFLGVIEKIPYLKANNIRRVLTGPFSDPRTVHGYHNENPYQVADRLGGIEGYKRFLVALGRNGITHQADMAIVNEGFEGLHFKDTLRWGKQSPFHNWFKSYGYKGVGLLPNVDLSKPENKELFGHFKIRVINGDKTYGYSDGSLDIKSATRDKSKPTYIQLYDDRLVSPELAASNEIIVRTDINKTKTHYEISSDNDSVKMNPIEVPEDELADLYARIEANKSKYENGESADFILSTLKFKNYRVTLNTPGQFQTWDGNTGTAKMNLTFTNKDENDLTLLGATEQEKEAYEAATHQVQDYAIRVAPFWVRFDRNVKVEDYAKTFTANEGDGSATAYKRFVKNNQAKNYNLPDYTPQVVSDEIIENVTKGDYQIPQLDATTVIKQRLNEDLMNYPLEAIEFSSDLTAVLGSPVLSKFAHTEEDVGVSRNDFARNNGYIRLPDEYRRTYYDMDDLYNNQITSLANRAIETADQKGNLGLFTTSGQSKVLSEKGQLALPLITDDIAKFLLVKALAPNVKVENKDGNLVYDRAALRNVNLRTINGGNGISGRTPLEQGRQVFELIKKGILSMSDDDMTVLSDSIKDRIAGVKGSDGKVVGAMSLNGLRMAYVAMDKDEMALHIRTDATKDMLEMDNIRNKTDQMGAEWERGIKFWGKSFALVHKENPNSIIITEMTDLEQAQLMKKAAGRFNDNLHAYRKFLEESGGTCISDYSYGYARIPILYTRNAENGASVNKGTAADNLIENFKESLNGANNWGGPNKGYLYGSSAVGVKQGHQFYENHDKPKMAHILMLDMGIFHDNPESVKAVEAAEKEYTSPEFRKKGLKADRKALAQAKFVYENLCKAVDQTPSITDKGKAKDKLKDATKDLVEGKFKKTTFNPEIFGVVDPKMAIEDVIIQAKEEHGLVLADDKEIKKLTRSAFALGAEDAAQKMHAINRAFMVMPGIPTLYQGYQLLMGGYETPCKNVWVQNRNVLDWESIGQGTAKPEAEGQVVAATDEDDGIKIDDFIKKHEEIDTQITNIRALPGLSALSTGDTVIVKAMQYDEAKEADRALAMYRYNGESEVLAVVHDMDVHRNIRKPDDKTLVDKEYNYTPGIGGYNKAPSIGQINLDVTHKDGKVIAGLAGGLALGTYFVEGVNLAPKIDLKDEAQLGKVNVYGVCRKKVGETISRFVKKFENIAEYKSYLAKPEAFVFGDAHKIDLPENVLVLRKVGKIHFGSKSNENHIKIQAYLNSKTHFGQEPKYTSLKKA